MDGNTGHCIRAWIRISWIHCCRRSFLGRLSSADTQGFDSRFDGLPRPWPGRRITCSKREWSDRKRASQSTTVERSIRVDVARGRSQQRVHDVTLSGSVQYVCQHGGQVEDKKFPLETQEGKPTQTRRTKCPSEPHLSMPWNSARRDVRKTGSLAEGNCPWWERRTISLVALRRGRCTLIEEVTLN